jgi:hypothetical protein
MNPRIGQLAARTPRYRTGEELFTREFTEPFIALIGHTVSEDEQGSCHPLPRRPVDQYGQDCGGGNEAAEDAPYE